jgi:hypothetical protein
VVRSIRNELLRYTPSSKMSGKNTWRGPNIFIIARPVLLRVYMWRLHAVEGVVESQSAIELASKPPTTDWEKPGSSHMKSPVAKRSIVVSGHKTSVSLEEASWSGIKRSRVSAASQCPI